MKLKGCSSLALAPLTGSWYRAVPLIHYKTLLRYSHTARIPSRFNAGSPHNAFSILYFAETPHLALFEAQAMLGSPLPGRVALPNPAGSWAIITVQVQLRHVADLTRPSQRRKVGTSVQELTGDWIGYRLRKPTPPATHPYTDVPTQLLGAGLAATAKLEAFLTYSARDSRHQNLVIFPQNLAKGSLVTFANPISKKTDRLGP
jgi:hypothetical protein